MRWLNRLGRVLRRFGTRGRRGATRRGQPGARMIALAQQPTDEAGRARVHERLGADALPHVTFVRPADTNPAINRYLQDHLVLRYPAPEGGPLVVFMSGTLSLPGAYVRLLDTMARRRGRVIGLEYVDGGQPGASTIWQICGRDPDPECPGRVRAARAFGGQEPGGQIVSAADGIVPRLVSLLRLLAREQPQAGWAAFMAGDAPNWPRIVLAGHSQGAGMAAFLARRYPVARVVMISGGADGNLQTRQAAAWMSGPSATPPERWYAMMHGREPNAAATQVGLHALGVPGPPVDWTAAGAMGRSHIAVVNRRAEARHESTATDLATPMRRGVARYAAVWEFLVG